MKKTTIAGVFVTGESEPRAIFNFREEADLYGYVRFGKDMYDVKVIKMKTKEIYSSLAFQEGSAFNQVMMLRKSLFKGGV